MQETRKISVLGCTDFLKIGGKKPKLGLDQTKENAFVLLTETAVHTNLMSAHFRGDENGI